MRPEPGLVPGVPAEAAVQILVVEDNAVNALILRAMLRKLGHEPLMASDGFEGIAMADRLRPRLVLMDLQMPRIDGLVAARTIGSLEGGGKIVLVAVTASAAPEVQDACEDAGFACILAKPIVLGELHSLLRRYLDA